MDRKGLVGLAAFGAIVAIFALIVVMSALMTPTNAKGETVSVPSGFSARSPDANVTFTFYVTNTNTTGEAANIGGNITNITVYFPVGFAFREGSNTSNITGFQFSNSSAQRALNFSNGTLALGNELSGLNSTYTGIIQFNLSVANYSGLYNFTVMTIDEAGVVNTTAVNIPVYRSLALNDTNGTSCGPPDSTGSVPRGCGAPGINNTGGFFFYDGENVTIVVNLTDRTTKVPISNLTVFVNFTSLGGSTNSSDDTDGTNLTAASYDAANGVYYAIGWVGFTNASTWIGSLRNNLKQAQIDVLIDTCAGSPSTNCNIGGSENTLNGTGQSVFAFAMLVNMSTFGCPPADDAQAAAMWSAMTNMPYYVNATNTTTVDIAGCVAYNEPLNSSYSVAESQNNYSTAYYRTASNFPPIVYNGTRYLMVSPNFGTLTTNISQLVQERQNMSNITLILDIPGTGRMNFSKELGRGVNFMSPDSMPGLMDFAMKSLVSRGRIAVNESEYDGTNISGRARPNLTVSAELTIYNVSGEFGLGYTPTIRYGVYNGTDAPTNMISCNSTRCSGMRFDGENLTFTVSSWSTYSVGSANYSLWFQNGTSALASVRNATLVANTSTGSNMNKTFYVNITNIGNSTETYNLSFDGVLECAPMSTKTSGCATWNRTSDNGTFVTLDEDSSVLLSFNFTANSTIGTYNFGVMAYKQESDSNATNFTWALNSSDDGVSWSVVVTPFQISIGAPTNGTNLSFANNVVFGLLSNYSTIKYANISINTTSTLPWNTTLPEGVINWSINNTALVNPTDEFYMNLTDQGWQQMQNVTVWVNDTWGNANSTIVHFVVDNTAPNIHNMTTNNVYTNATYYQNYSNTSIVLNLSAGDSSTGTHSISLVITNISNKVVNLTNLTEYINSTAFMSNWTVTLNPSN